jgi:hypothetical protein
MRRLVLGLAAALGVVALLVAGCGGDDEAAPTETETATSVPSTLPETGMVLRGSVGPGFEISLTDDAGEPVTTLAPGSYTLMTDDKSDIHNFHLSGEGVDVGTGVGETGTDSFDVDLAGGTYSFVCDPHASSMNGSVEVSG